jgi:hypothetical protein
MPLPPALATAALAFSIFVSARSAVPQHGQEAQGGEAALQIAPASGEGQEQIASFQLAPGLVCDLIAAEPDVCNIVAFAIDGKGRVYVAETFRINDGVFDTRSYMQWKDEDLACLTVADRLAMYQRHIPDRIPGYAAFPERIRLLTDRNGDGIYDHSTVFADSFRAMADAEHVTRLDLKTTPVAPHPIHFPLIQEAHDDGRLTNQDAVAAWRAAAASLGLAAPDELEVPADAGSEPLEDVIVRRGSTRLMRSSARCFVSKRVPV